MKYYTPAVEEAATWRAIQDQHIPPNMKQSYELIITLVNSDQIHRFQCTASNPVSALNKYLWHTKSMNLTIRRVIQISEFPSKDLKTKLTITS